MSYESDKHQAARIAELEAAQSVGVKPLVWFIGSGRANDGDHETQTMLGTYSCRRHDNGRWSLWKSERRLSDEEYTSVVSAKAAAQVDYEHRILSALQPVPVTVQQAELIKALEEIRELNMTGRDENGHRWASSDLIDQTITLALSQEGTS